MRHNNLWPPLQDSYTFKYHTPEDSHKLIDNNHDGQLDATELHQRIKDNSMLHHADGSRSGSGSRTIMADDAEIKLRIDGLYESKLDPDGDG